MKTMEVTVVYEVETSSDLKEVARDLGSRLDGYMPPGGDLDYQVTEAKVQSARVTDNG